MIPPFEYAGSPARIVFGAGRARDVAAELARLPARRALVVGTAGQRLAANAVAAALGAQCAAMFAEAVMHTPVATTVRALDLATAHGCDGVPRSLQEIGMPGSGLDAAADLALRDAYWNPRPLERKALRAMLGAAYAGDAPRAP